MATSTKRVDQRKLLIRVAEAAERLGVSQRFVRDRIALRELPHVRLGRLMFIYEPDLEAFIRSNRVG